MYKIDEKTGIKYFTRPEVYLIASSKPEEVDLLKYLGDYDLLLPNRDWSKEIDDEPNTIVSEVAGRHCYMSFNEKAKTGSHDSYMKNIIERCDFSLLEHSYFTFLIRGASRGTIMEFNRHRHLSPSQQSTRYVDEEELCFVQPALEVKYKLPLEGFLQEAKHSYEIYMQKVEHYQTLMSIDLSLVNVTAKETRKMARGAAREYLAHILEAPVVYSGNGRAWREMIEKRYSRHADLAIYNIARMIYNILAALATNNMWGCKHD